MEMVSGWLDTALRLLSEHAVIAVVILTGALDLALRLWKTTKPVDVLRAASAFCKALKLLLDRLAALLAKAAEVLDKVLPQNVKPAAVPAPAPQEAVEAPKEP